VSLSAFADQLGVALEREVPPGQKAEWVVMAAWLLQLRSHLLLPATDPGRIAAHAEAGQLRDRLQHLQHMQALAAWLDARPQLGREVFARGQPEFWGGPFSAEHEVDVIEFLWAAMALFDDDLPAADTVARHRSHWRGLYSFPEALLRIMRVLQDCPGGTSLSQLLPGREAGTERESETVLRRRSAWTSTFVASLELAKQGAVSLEQEAGFSAIHVSAASACSQTV